VRTAALSNLSSEAVPDAPSLPNQALTPQPDFAMTDCCTRLANKINAARSTNPLIWTALTLSRPFATISLQTQFGQDWLTHPSIGTTVLRM
jgi:hypothetical protein